jgi:DNA-binding HxlR family transcriptional regulator
VTELGCSLLTPVNALGTWARQNKQRIQHARVQFDAAQGRRTKATSTGS